MLQAARQNLARLGKTCPTASACSWYWPASMLPLRSLPYSWLTNTALCKWGLLHGSNLLFIYSMILWSLFHLCKTPLPDLCSCILYDMGSFNRKHSQVKIRHCNLNISEVYSIWLSMLVFLMNLLPKGLLSLQSFTWFFLLLSIISPTDWRIRREGRGVREISSGTGYRLLVNQKLTETCLKMSALLSIYLMKCCSSNKQTLHVILLKGLLAQCLSTFFQQWPPS